MLGTTPGLLRAIGEARLITPLRSEGGHRRCSRYHLRIAARARELVDQGTPIEAACRIIILEDQLEEARASTPNTAAPADRPVHRPQQEVSGPAGIGGLSHPRVAGLRRAKPLIARRGTEHGSGLGSRRWVVERAFAHLHWSRRLRIRWEIRDDIHEAFLTLGCALICWRRRRSCC
ncbi:hypothetical protein GCM10018980_22800 [Streptomyces capoamus]|uniref:HTH merR-type domain-containing protein n=1 Tax=Streptomyces capoamus TaxID=68183 RepID=A0A919C571_9ACTN|nr:hypothetical protein GCM10010501_01090 [Streptomyces libani subsp. rufus]GHG44665.1 hypothetical protein GCM10018980_22800 [Streptomyces capoamus]